MLQVFPEAHTSWAGIWPALCCWLQVTSHLQELLRQDFSGWLDLVGPAPRHLLTFRTSSLDRWILVGVQQCNVHFEEKLTKFPFQFQVQIEDQWNHYNEFVFLRSSPGNHLWIWSPTLIPVEQAAAVPQCSVPLFSLCPGPLSLQRWTFTIKMFLNNQLPLLWSVYRKQLKLTFGTSTMLLYCNKSDS